MKEEDQVASIPLNFWGNSFPSLTIASYQETNPNPVMPGYGTAITQQSIGGNTKLLGINLGCLQKNQLVNVQVVDAYIQLLNLNHDKSFCFSSGFNPLTSEEEIWKPKLEYWFEKVYNVSLLVIL
jgi:hypothetical protein